jgi:hypothetical protein
MLIIENMGSSDKESVIKDAIENGYTITFFYMGKDYEEKKKRGENPIANYRRVEPFAIGKTKNGNPVFRGFQYAGATNSKNGVYKMFRIDQIRGDVKFVYDSKGQAIRSYEPRKYKEKREYKDGSVRYVDASYRDNGTDKHMKGGVNNYFDVDRENLTTIPVKEPQPTKPGEPTVKKPMDAEPEMDSDMDNVPMDNQPKRQPYKLLPKRLAEPQLPDEEEEMAQLDKITQDQNQYTTDDELELELAESVSSGFLKWIYKLYESR